MKIALYHDLVAGGAKRSIDAIENILKTKHEVKVFSSPSFEFGGSFGRIFSDFNSLVIQKFAAEKLAQTIDQEKFDVVLVTHDRYLQCPWLLRFLKTPSLFLCQEPTRSFYEYFLRIPDDLPIHNYLYEKLNRYVRKTIEESNARHATALAANSKYSAESIFRAYGVYPTPVYLGINQNEYFVEKITKKNQIIVVGNDEPQKDLDLAIETVSMIKRNRPKLIITSPRPYDQKRLTNLAKRKKVNLQILIGRSIEQQRELYCQSKITLATAHLEPFGLSVIESMASGTPVVAVEEGGFRETVIDGVTGYLTKRDSEALAERCEKLLSSPLLQKTMGKAGLKHVTTHFTWDITVNNLVKLLSDVKKRKSRHYRP